MKYSHDLEIEMRRGSQWFFFMMAVMLLTTTGMAESAGYLQDHAGNMAHYADRVQNGDWHAAIVQAMNDTPEGGVIYFPQGEYRVDQPIEITKSVSLIFENGTRLWTRADDLIRIVRGEQIILEGIGGRAELVSQAAKDPVFNEARGFPTGNITSVISLNHVAMDAQPSLRVKSLKLEGFRCIEGYVAEEKGPMGLVEVLDCHLVGEDMHMSHRHSEVQQLRVEDSLFTGNARMGIFFTSPMPGGAVVKNNILKNVGIRAIQLSGGKVNMIADGAVEYLPSAIVHDNQILGGGHRAQVTTSYIMGILVYGHNISIQGNIVRDFNRGEPVPGEPYGQHMRMPDGSYYRGIWIEDETRDDKRGRRLAGAAIYAKARQGIISGNICTNSGWRSVIEVKTGGREPFVMVTNNLVDGSSLCIEDSYGFEPGSGQSVWANNLVYNMPAVAFAVRGGRQNSYINNVIINAKTGFTVPEAGAGEELLMNNRFVNVEQPVAGMSSNQPTAQRTPPAPLVVPSYAALPAPSEAQRGRLAVVLGEEGDEMLVCQYVDNAYRWTTLGEGEAKEIAGPVQWDPARFEAVGPNLILNPDQSQDGPEADAPDAARWKARGYDVFPFGWAATVSQGELGQVMQYDPAVYEHGSRSLRIGDGEETFNWQIVQEIPVAAGKTYRAEAWMRTRGDKASTRLIVDVGSNQYAETATGSSEWERVMVIFQTPEEGIDKIRLRLWGSRAGNGQQVWIDRVALHEVQVRESGK